VVVAPMPPWRADQPRSSGGLAGWLKPCRNQERLERLETVVAWGRISERMGTYGHTDPDGGKPPHRARLGRSPTPSAHPGDRTAIGNADSSRPWLLVWHLPGTVSPLKSATSTQTDVLEGRKAFCQGPERKLPMPPSATPIRSERISGNWRACCAATTWPPWRRGPPGNERDISTARWSE